MNDDADANDPRNALAKRIDAMEEAYEFMLAYAAQGREGDEEEPDGGVREFLQRASSALDGLGAAIEDCLNGEDSAWRKYLETAADDAGKAQAAIDLVLAQQRISSQLIDNLNASVHVRAILTDLFLIDEALKAGD